MKRMIAHCLLPIAYCLFLGGCMTNGSRSVDIQANPDGSWKAHYESGSDAKVANLTATLPNGVTIHLEGLDTNASNANGQMGQVIMYQSGVLGNLGQRALSAVPGTGPPIPSPEIPATPAARPTVWAPTSRPASQPSP